MERVTGGFVGHLVRGEFAQLLIDERQQFLRGFGIAVLDGFEESRDVAHGARLWKTSRETTSGWELNGEV